MFNPKTTKLLAFTIFGGRGYIFFKVTKMKTNLSNIEILAFENHYATPRYQVVSPVAVFAVCLRGIKKRDEFTMTKKYK